jgi:hypothetical protein
MFAREIPLLTAQPGHGNCTLPLQESDHGSDRVLGGNRDTHMHVVRHEMPFDYLALLLGPAHGKSVPDDGASARISPFVVAWARTRHGTCSPIWNGIGFDKDLTIKILLSSSRVLIKPLEEDFIGTVKPLRVSLVEPVAYPKPS